jgi:hypothetical protein|tara:strand:- start:441 stop:698 length:258 start_codon:yes stop_codon:yes gene_type:complete
MAGFKLILLALLVWSCNTIVIDKPPIIDKNGKSHKYTTPNLEMINQVWCETHLKWEEVTVSYSPTILSKLRKVEYIVEKASNESQ